MMPPALLLLAAIAQGQVTEDRPVRVPVVRDAWVSNVGDEAIGNNGGAHRLKVKSIQEMTLLDIDPGPLRGRVVKAATLHMRLPGPGSPPLGRVTVSSLAADWVEGTASNYAPQPGAVNFREAQAGRVPWSPPDGDLTTAAFGQGGTLWRMADAFPPNAQGWQRVAVDPAVVAARVAGVSGGFLVFDDTGTEWDRDGDRFTLNLFPNRFVSSREAGASQTPYLTVWLGDEDREPPAAPAEIRTEPATADLPAGEALVSWDTPEDRGPAGTVGFLAELDGRPLPKSLVPAAGGRATMHLRDLGLEPGSEARLTIRAVDGAGNVGPPAEAVVKLSARVPKPLPGRTPEPFVGAGPLPRVGGREVAIVDELDKAHPLTGAMIPEQPAGYLAANHLWDAKSRTLRLHAAKGEAVAFQVLLIGRRAEVRAGLRFDGPAAPKLRAEFGRYQSVAAAGGPQPDPIVPLGAPYQPPAGLTREALHAELYVPKDTPAGEHRGTLALASGGEVLNINVTLRVWDFTLPDHLSFLPEMNSYGLPANERDYYRLAHRHRTVLNRLAYYHNGRVEEGCAPAWDGERLDWSAWDARFGPLLDGSAFADLPRAGVPVECFYLPLFENWLTPIEPHYNGDYWADRAFTPQYREAFVEASRQFAAHFHERSWGDTLFHFYLNGKTNFKQAGWSRGTSPWLLDEPANFQDYWALRWFGAAFHEGVAQAEGPAQLLFRADISRPEWQRDSLDGLLDYNVVSGAMRKYHRMVMDRKAAEGQILVEYGGTNGIEQSNMQPVGWAIDAWALGADGILPWQTIGNDQSWQQADDLSLFYPARRGDPGPIPSVRLKAYRRGQQDVEYLTLLAEVQGEPRWAVGRAAREALRLAGRREGTGFAGGEDAGRIDFAALKPQDVWAVRVRVGEALSAARPEPRDRLVDLRTPRRDPSALPSRYVSAGDVPPPPPPRFRTAAPSAAADPRFERVLQGRAAVRDALLDPERPDTPLGSEGRANAITMRERSAALLLRFDLAQLDPIDAGEVESAELTIFVWDPSSRGRTRLAAQPLATPWDEAAATWTRPAPGRAWAGGAAFEPGRDTQGPIALAIVEPDDEGQDVADPPREVRLDVTAAVRDWLDGRRPNHGIALVPARSRAVDEGHHTRFQVYASEYENRNVQVTPRLTVRLRPRGE